MTMQSTNAYTKFVVFSSKKAVEIPRKKSVTLCTINIQGSHMM